MSDFSPPPLRDDSKPEGTWRKQPQISQEERQRLIDFKPPPRPPQVVWLVLIYAWNAVGLLLIGVLGPDELATSPWAMPVRSALILSGLLAAGLAYSVHHRYRLALLLQTALWWLFSGFMAFLMVVDFAGLEAAVFGTTGKIKGSPIGAAVAAVGLYFILKQCHALLQYGRTAPPPEDIPAQPGWDEGSRR